MKTFSNQVIIQVSQEEAFKAFTDFENSPRVLHQAFKVQFSYHQKTGVGTKWVQFARSEEDPTISSFEVTAFDPNSSYTMMTEDNHSWEEMTFEFSAGEHATKVTMTVRTKAKSFAGKIISLLFGGGLKQAMLDDLQRMKAVIEEGEWPPAHYLGTKASEATSS